MLHLFFSQEKDHFAVLLQQEKNPSKKLELYQNYLQEKVTQDFDKSIQLSNQAMIISKSLKDKKSEGNLLRLKGNAHYFKGNLDSASFYYFKALTILENTNSPKETAETYNNLGRFFRKTKDYNRSLSYYDKALNVYQKINDWEGIGTIYNESGVVYEYLKNYDEAISRYKKSLEIRRNTGDKVGEGYALEFIGGCYILQKKYQEAEKYLTDALRIRLKTKDSFAISLNYNVLGNLYLEKKDFLNAEKNYNLSNSIAEKLGYLDLLAQNYQQLSNLYQNSGRLDLALQNLQIHKKLNDSIFNLGKIKQIEELSVKYETVEKDNEILIQKSKIFKRNVAVISLLAVLMLAFVYYKNYQNKQKLKLQKEILHQQDLATKAVMEAEDQERKRMAIHLHDGVGQLLTATNMNLQVIKEFKEDENAFETMFLKTQKILQEAMGEVRTLSHQIMPNMLIKNSLSNALKELIDKTSSPKLKISLKIEGLQDNLDENIQVVMFRVIQECINNTIKHANATEIMVEVLQNKHLISAAFRDNGKGFNVKNFQSKSDGMGIENIKSRIEFLKGEFNIISSEGKGTQVDVKIPMLR